MIKYIKALSDLLIIFLTVNFFLCLVEYIPASGNVFILAAAFSIILNLKTGNKYYKAALIIILMALVILMKTLSDIATVILIFFSVFYLYKRNKNKLSYGEAVEGVRKSFVFIIIVLIISGLYCNKDAGKYILPYAFFYLAVSVYQLKYLRNYEYNLVNKKLDKINMIYFISIIILTFISALKSVRLFLINIFKFLYDKIMDVFIYIFSMIFYVIYSLLGNIKIKGINPDIFKISSNQTNSRKPAGTGESFVLKYPFVYKIFFIISNILLIILVFYIIVRLLGKKDTSRQRLEKYDETKEFILEKKQSKVKKRFLFDYYLKIRYYYLKLLKDSETKGIRIEKSDTTMDIYKNSQDVYNKTSTWDMRNIYIETRYGNKPCNKEKVKEIALLYKKRKL